MLYRLLVLALAAVALPAAAQRPGGDAPLACPAGRAELVCITRSGPNYRFRYVYPIEAARIAALDARLREDAEFAEAAVAAAAVATEGGAPLLYDSWYRLDANLPELIALSGRVTGDVGAAAPDRAQAIMVDPRNGERLELIDLFHAETFDTNLFWSRIRGIRSAQRSFCSALIRTVHAARLARGDVALDFACPDLEDQVVTMVCNGRGRILAMRALLDGRTSRVVDAETERDYAVDFPVTAEMIGTMKQRYRVAFGLPGETRGRRRRSCPGA